MKDENGNDLTDEQILNGALEHLSDACALLYELESPEGIAAAVFVDSALRYAQAVSKGHDPRLGEEFYEGEL